MANLQSLRAECEERRRGLERCSGKTADIRWIAPGVCLAHLFDHVGRAQVERGRKLEVLRKLFQISSGSWHELAIDDLVEAEA